MIEEIDTHADEHRWPCCPLMSGQPVQVKPPPGAIMQANQVAISPMMVPCVEDKCPIYDPQSEVCGLQSATTLSYRIAELVDIFKSMKLIFEPPKNSPSPLMRLAQAVEALVENSQKKG